MDFPPEPRTRPATRTVHLFTRALREPRFRFLVVATFVLVLLSALLMRVFDHKDFDSYGLALWWAGQTVTTVGYGDVVPHQAFGRVVAVVLMILAIGFLAVLTSIIASSFVVADPETRRRQEEVVAALRASTNGSTGSRPAVVADYMRSETLIQTPSAKGIDAKATAMPMITWSPAIRITPAMNPARTVPRAARIGMGQPYAVAGKGPSPQLGDVPVPVAPLSLAPGS